MAEDKFDASALLENNPRQRLVPGNRDGEPGNVNQRDGELEEPVLEPAPEFTLLKMYLRATVLWWPSKEAVEEEAVGKKVVKAIVQLTILGGLMLIYFFQLGVFGSHTLVDIEYNETVTTVKNIIWFSQMPVMYIFGIFYFPKRHLESILNLKVNLTARCWRKTKKAIKRSFFAVIVFAFVVPLSSKATQMILNAQGKIHQNFKQKEILMNLGFSALARFFSLPILFVFILVVCIISSDIRQFKEQIKEWPANKKEEARNRFINIKLVIKHAQKAFQPFLVTQLVFLCVLLLPSIFSVVERLEAEASYKMTLIDPVNIKEASRGEVDTENANSTASSLRLNGGETLLTIRPPRLSKVMNRGQEGWFQEITERTELVTTWQGIVKVVFGGLSDFLEMFIVYSFPLVLLTRLHNKMTTLPEVVQNLKFSEQRESGYLFQDKKVLKEMLKVFSSGKGIQILRMNLTGVKAVFITLLTPFLTTAYHLLFLDIKLKS